MLGSSLSGLCLALLSAWTTLTILVKSYSLPTWFYHITQILSFSQIPWELICLSISPLQTVIFQGYLYLPLVSPRPPSHSRCFISICWLTKPLYLIWSHYLLSLTSNVRSSVGYLCLYQYCYEIQISEVIEHLLQNKYVLASGSETTNGIHNLLEFYKIKVSSFLKYCGNQTVPLVWQWTMMCL